jgi:hypothetical protein
MKNIAAALLLSMGLISPVFGTFPNPPKNSY